MERNHTGPHELLPPGRPIEDRENARDQLARYQARMREAYIRAFPPFGRTTASRMRSFHGQQDALGYLPTPGRSRRSR